MAYADPITVDNASNVATNFSRTSTALGESHYVNGASSPAEPEGLIIKHQVSGKGADQVDRHLVQYYHTEINADGKPRVAVINLTIAVPRDTIITEEMVANGVANLFDFISTGQFAAAGDPLELQYLQKLLRGET
jgi:hypothetical protein